LDVFGFEESNQGGDGRIRNILVLCFNGVSDTTATILLLSSVAAYSALAALFFTLSFVAEIN
jgi:hypothetical protein